MYRKFKLKKTTSLRVNTSSIDSEFMCVYCERYFCSSQGVDTSEGFVCKPCANFYQIKGFNNETKKEIFFENPEETLCV